MNEMQDFIQRWDFEAERTARLIESLPRDAYDFRPDPKGRSLGELAWHLAELEGYMTHGIQKGAFSIGDPPPGIERPRGMEDLAPGYRRVHAEAKARIEGLQPGDMERQIPFFVRGPMAIRHILWGAVYGHLIHHRGQLLLMCRLAGGTPPGLYGPTREESERLRAGAS